MYVPSFIRIERGSDRGHVLKLNDDLLFAKNPVNINISRSGAPKLAPVPVSFYNCVVKSSYVNVRGMIKKYMDFPHN